MKKFELIKIGDKAKIEHVINQSDIDYFIKAINNTSMGYCILTVTKFK